jgi:hypothetical protein
MPSPQLGVETTPKFSSVTGASTGIRPRKNVYEMVRPWPGPASLHLTRSPRSVTLRQATGGFNCVVEASADLCRRVFSLEVEAPLYDIPIPTPDLRAFIDARSDSLTDQVRNVTLENRPSYDLLVGFGPPSSLQFEDPHRVRVSYRGSIALAKVDIPHPLPHGHDVALGGLPDPIGPVESFELRSEAELFTAAPRPAAVTQITSPLSSASWSGIQQAIWASRRHGPPPGATTTIVAELGQLSLDLVCSYHAKRDPALARCDVLASLSQAELNLSLPTGDGQVFIDGFMGTQATQLLTQLWGPPEAKLTPTVSVVGRNPAGARVTEFTDCAAEVFHVSYLGDQAMAVAFDLMPGCHGIVEEVEQFLCGRDYGVISDEWVVSRVLENKWRHGGFYRRLSSDQAVRIKRNGHEEDASVHFDLSLDDLDAVAIETDANTATDFLRLGGSATATPRYLRLADGSVHGPDEVDLGAATNRGWTVFTGPSLTAHPGADWQLRLFQARASEDAYRHLSRPFAAFPDTGVDLDYIRLEGVEKHLFFLGNCREAFL